MKTANSYFYYPRNGLKAAILCASVVTIAGCGKHDDKLVTQVAAKVNKEEITVHQINFLLQREHTSAFDNINFVKKKILDQLIDQELSIQAAEAEKISRQPEVMAAIDAARREVIAAAYAERVAGAASKPTDQEIHVYYDANPALFKSRRIYQWLDTVLDVPPDSKPALIAKLGELKSMQNIEDFLNEKKIRHATETVIRPAEQMPLRELEKLSRMADGDISIIDTDDGLHLLVLTASRAEPIGEAQASSSIERFLTNERKRQLIQDDRRALRDRARIVYTGDFADKSAGVVAPTSGQ